MSNDRHLNVVAGGRTATDALEDIHLTVDCYVVPLAGELKRFSDADDLDGVRAVSYELLTLAGTLIACCPRPAGDSRF